MYKGITRQKAEQLALSRGKDFSNVNNDFPDQREKIDPDSEVSTK